MHEFKTFLKNDQKYQDQKFSSQNKVIFSTNKQCSLKLVKYDMGQ